MSVILHPNWVTKAGIGDIVRHFDMRGFDVSNIVGSRFFCVKEKQTVTTGCVKQHGFRSINFFRGPTR